jgi:hypothetical protein
MTNSFQQRTYKILNRLVGYELDKAFQEYHCASRSNSSYKRAYNRLGRLATTLSRYGILGRRIAAENGIPLDDDFTETLSGGKADGRAPSDFDEAALEKGQKVELEHTDDYDIAIEIAQDHLSEFPTYYDALDKMEKSLKDKEADNEEMGTQTIGDNPMIEPANEELAPTDKTLNAPSRRPGPYAKRA